MKREKAGWMVVVLVGMLAGMVQAANVTWDPGKTGSSDGTGPTVLNSGVTQLGNAGNRSTGNFALNGGMLTDYYRQTHIFTGGLGAGNNQIQIYGASGFGGGNQTSNWRIGAQNSALQWGSTYFNPTTLKFLAPLGDNMGSSIYGWVVLQNGLDLNGGARTIDVFSSGAVPFNSQATITGTIANSTNTAGVIKTGAGRLILSGSRTYNGDTTVSNGFLQVNSINANDDAASVSIDSGASLILNFSGTDTIYRLMINGEYQEIGEYGHTNSSATNGGLGLGALDAHFGAGNGKLNVTMGPPPPAGTVLIVK